MISDTAPRNCIKLEFVLTFWHCGTVWGSGAEWRHAALHNRFVIDTFKIVFRHAELWLVMRGWRMMELTWNDSSVTRHGTFLIWRPLFNTRTVSRGCLMLFVTVMYAVAVTSQLLTPAIGVVRLRFIISTISHKLDILIICLLQMCNCRTTCVARQNKTWFSAQLFLPTAMCHNPRPGL